MNDVKQFDHEVFGKLEVVMYDDKPAFYANDVATTLGYVEARDGRKHCKSLIKLNLGDTHKLGLRSNGNHGTFLINESDVYRMVMKSELPNAVEFQDWVMEEVLPTIRNTGGYVDSVDQIMKTFYGHMDETTQAVIRAGLVFQKDNQHKIDFFSQVADTSTLKRMNEVAKVFGVGRNQMFDKLRELGILMSDNAPYQRHIEEGHFKVKQTSKNGQVYNLTLVTGKGEQYLYKKLVAAGFIKAKL